MISADGKNIRIVTLRDVFRAKQSLQSVEGILSGNFLRVSRFEIINLKMVRKYDFTLVGTLRIEFENGILNETVVNTSGFPEQIVQELFPDGPSVFSDPFTVVIEEESQYPKEITVSQVEDKTVAPPAEVVLPYTGQPQECPYKATAGYTVSLNDPQTDAGSEYY